MTTIGSLSRSRQLEASASNGLKLFMIYSDIRLFDNWAVACDFQQCGILTSLDSDEPVQPPVQLRNFKFCWVSSFTFIDIQATSKSSDQSARMRRLV